jgi:ribosome-binding protein aMBF1 (putative translation factor)
MKCDICGKSIQETFLKKPLGTLVRVKGKKKAVCMHCQKILTMEEIRKKLE